MYHVFEFTRSPSEYRDALLHHPQLKAAADALPYIQDGVYIYVHPEQYGPAREYLTRVGVDFGDGEGNVLLQQLRSRHIIVNNDLSGAVLDALSRLKGGLKVKLKRTAWFFLQLPSPTPRYIYICPSRSAGLPGRTGEEGGVHH